MPTTMRDCQHCYMRPAQWTLHTDATGGKTAVLGLNQHSGYHPYPIVEVCDKCKQIAINEKREQ